MDMRATPGRWRAAAQRIARGIIRAHRRRFWARYFTGQIVEGQKVSVKLGATGVQSVTGQVAQIPQVIEFQWLRHGQPVPDGWRVQKFGPLNHHHRYGVMISREIED